ncbi:MAG: hypothetical protein IKD96_01350 [Oscillospiraceae bacterium]|nr:hypothetical protein [Oscillospiraceae bacterium]
MKSRTMNTAAQAGNTCAPSACRRNEKHALLACFFAALAALIGILGLLGLLLGLLLDLADSTPAPSRRTRGR